MADDDRIAAMTSDEAGLLIEVELDQATIDRFRILDKHRADLVDDTSFKNAYVINGPSSVALPGIDEITKATKLTDSPSTGTHWPTDPASGISKIF